jgi:GntR family transcriptional regulator, carbon starvation induced regulator
VLKVSTQTEKAISVIRRAILQGELRPSDRLHIHDLARRYELGVTPVREALSRLCSVGLVAAIGQRGFRTAATNPEDFRDIVTTRILIETEALRISLRKGDDRWRDNVITALHDMHQQIQHRSDTSYEGDDVFDELHKKFHASLVSACGSERMTQYCSELYDSAYRYRRTFMARPKTREAFWAEHEELARLVLLRDEVRATAFLTLHLSATLTVLDVPASRR